MQQMKTPPSHLPPEDAVDHDDDKPLQGVEDGKKDLEERRAPVGDGQDCRHPGESQQGQHHTGAPEGCPGREKERAQLHLTHFQVGL